MGTKSMCARIRNTALTLLATATVCLSGGCASCILGGFGSMFNPKLPEGKEPPVTLKALKPLLSPLPETKEYQEKGGIGLTVIPVAYSVEETTRATEKQHRTYTKHSIASEVPIPMVQVEKTIMPLLVTQPDRVKFQVKISNKQARVFRGAGAIVQFIVSGRQVVVDAESTAELAAAIVPPRSDVTVYINGPLLKDMPDRCPIGIMIYDIVTQQDVAGTVTEKQNYEWYFNYTTTPVERQLAIKTEYFEVSQMQMMQNNMQRQMMTPMTTPMVPMMPMVPMPR
ncbi:MAG: hypothetical protein FWG50_10045 [Kiritimatiellaeota bacterium]|nr:hypothetical protein [Kiritimatiellota bacterium]